MSTSELADLVRRAQAGEADALSDLLGQLQNMVYYTALKLLGDPHDAEDASQEVFVKVLESLPQLREPKAVLNWVSIITQNVCKNHLKARGSRVFVDDGEAFLSDLPEAADDLVPDRYMDMAAKREIILGMIAALPEKQRLTVYLYYYNGSTVKEIAQYMEVSEGTVKSRLAAARANLQDMVEDEARKGNKLYVIFPFLGRLLWEDAKTVHLPPLGIPPARIAAAAGGYAATAARASGAAGSGAAAVGEAATAVSDATASAASSAPAAGDAAASAGTKAVAAAGKAGTRLGVKIAAGVAAAAVLTGGTAVLSGALRDSAGPAGALAPLVEPFVRPFAEPDAPYDEPYDMPYDEPYGPYDVPYDEPYAEAGPYGFDAESLLGRPISAMTDLLGEPLLASEGAYMWCDAELTYQIFAAASADDHTLGVSVINGPPILGVGFGDSSQAAWDALSAIAGEDGVAVADGEGQVIYTAVSADGRYIYQFTCTPWSDYVTSCSVLLNAAAQPGASL